MSYPPADAHADTEDRELVHTVARRELVCPVCGYGIVVEHAPDQCPMCGSEQWDFAEWRPFSGATVHALRRTTLTH